MTTITTGKAPSKAPSKGKDIVPIVETNAIAAVETETPETARRRKADEAAARIVETVKLNPASTFAKMIAMVYRSEIARNGNGNHDGARIVAGWLYREATARANGLRRGAFERAAWEAMKGFLRSVDADAAKLQGRAFAQGLALSDDEAREIAAGVAHNKAVKAEAARHRRFQRDEAAFKALAGKTPAEVAFMLDSKRAEALIDTAHGHVDAGRRPQALAAIGRARAILATIDAPEIAADLAEIADQAAAL